MGKPILCLDFDGVLHSYTSGWQGADVIPDPPVPGAIEFLAEASKHFRIAIFSSRSHQEGGISAMQLWLAIHVNGEPYKGGTVDEHVLDALGSKTSVQDLLMQALDIDAYKKCA